MTTIARTVYHSKAMNTQPTWYSKFIKEATYNYFFLISFVILLGSCLGGIAAMQILKADAPVWQLCVNIYITMASNVAAIGQAPAKWVVNIFAASLVANIAFIVAYML